MNKKALALYILLFGTFLAHAQGPVRDRIKTLKVAFITEHVGLTSKEAQEFWPIYNDHEEIMEDIRRKERAELRNNIANAQELSTNESEQLLDNLIALQSKKQKAEEDYLSKMRDAISAKKVLLLIKAEEDFKRQMIQQFRKRREGGRD